MQTDTTPDDQFLSDAQATGATLLVLEDADLVLDLLESNFPFSTGRIAWDAKDLWAKKGGDNDDNWKHTVATAIQSIHTFLKDQNPEIQFLLVGDDYLEEAYQLDLDSLQKIVPLLVGLPQQSYLISEDGAWALNYTFEDELYSNVPVQ